jgi:putative NADPH-quinone reductase
LVAAHIEQLRWADALVFVYPTWWSGLPAILKGWLDRTMLPGVAFRLDQRTRKVRGALDVQFLVGITTYGSPAWFQRVFGDAGRRTITRTLRLVCPRTTRSRWLALDRLDGRGQDERTAFLGLVEETMRSLNPAARTPHR